MHVETDQWRSLASASTSLIKSGVSLAVTGCLVSFSFMSIHYHCLFTNAIFYYTNFCKFYLVHLVYIPMRMYTCRMNNETRPVTARINVDLYEYIKDCADRNYRSFGMQFRYFLEKGIAADIEEQRNNSGDKKTEISGA